jgi:hypothetical protein
MVCLCLRDMEDFVEVGLWDSLVDETHPERNQDQENDDWDDPVPDGLKITWQRYLLAATDYLRSMANPPSMLVLAGHGRLRRGRALGQPC